jgi:DNA-binding NarL/FixJ family response regulator
MVGNPWFPLQTEPRVLALSAYAYQRGVSLLLAVYTGRKPGTTKAKPSRARALKKQGLTVAEIATALDVKERTVYHYLSRY